MILNRIKKLETELADLQRAVADLLASAEKLRQDTPKPQEPALLVKRGRPPKDRTWQTS